MQPVSCKIMMLTAALLSGCAIPSEIMASRSENATLSVGPPIEDVRTGFDEALTCIRGKIPRNVVFAVGQVIDATGKENYAEGGAGKYVTQGAGEMVQTALFRAGVSVVNRRDSTITINEANWGIRDIKRQVPVNFYISGSVNSLDFIPGGGASATIAGIGPRYRQSRILIALDLTMTDAYSGRVVASVPVQKQIFTSESGIAANTFFGTTLLQLDAGGMEREALHFALRQMLNLASFELLGQMMPTDAYASCRTRISETAGEIRSTGTSDPEAMKLAFVEASSAQEQAETLAAEAAAVAAAGPENAAPASAGGAPAPAPQAAAAKTNAELLGDQAVKAATLAIRAARDSEAAADPDVAIAKASESLQLSNLALRALREAAAQGFTGDAGEVAAVVVQQALQAAKDAGTAAANRSAVAKDKEGTTTPKPGTVADGDPSPPSGPHKPDGPAPAPNATGK